MQNKQSGNSEFNDLSYKNIIDGADIGTWVWNFQTNKITYNEKWASILGYTLNELKPLNTDTWKKLAHPDDVEKVISSLNNYLDGKSEYYECRFRMKHKEGHWLWILDKGKIITDENNGEAKIMTGMHLDVTEKMQLQEDVMKQTAFQKLLLKIASTYINVNLDEVDSIIQQSLKEMAEFVHADRAYIFSYDFQSSSTSNTFEWCAEGISPEIDNLQLLSMDSVPHWVSKHLRGQPLYIPDVNALPDDGPLGLRAILEPQGIQSLITIPMIHEDDLLGFVGFDFVRDPYELSEKEITLLTLFSNMLVNIQDRKNKDLKLNSFLSITQNQNEKLKHFAHILSHNIRSHSSNISMILALISDEYPELHEFQLIRLLNTASDKLSETIRHLNKVILINTSSPEKLTSLNLHDIIEHTIRTLSYMAKNEGVTIENNVPSDTIVKGVESYLDSILMNLITNGIKYCSDERESYVTLYIEEVNNHLVICVEDNGLGINLEKNRDKIFGMYKTFHEHPDSRGIGLFITKNQIEAMGGKIEVESEVGKGSIFKIYLPHDEYK